MPRVLPPAVFRSLEYAVVVAAEVTRGTGVLADEPITTATLRKGGERGGTTEDHLVRIVGGPTTRGGFAHLAGYVVPILGARVRLDLRAEDRHSSSLLGPFPSWVPNAPAGAWPASKLPVVFDLAMPPSRDLGVDAAAEIEVAARTWARPSCTAFRARFGAMKALVPADDGESGVFFHDDAWPAELVAGALAQTIVHTDGSGNVRDADIHVNGAEFRFSKDGSVGTHDLRGVLVHEIGHALGLGHTSDARATMSLAGSGLRWRSLERDDVDGVCALYPGVGGRGCDDDPCPDGFVCVANACQRPGDRADVCSPCAPDPGACEAAGDDARCIQVGAGATAGRVCGRGCATDADCGATFACRPTTEAGDLQCVSLDDCKSGANTCTTSAECTHPGAHCRGGACVGTASGAPGSETSDAGAIADGGSVAGIAGSGSGCSCRAAARHVRVADAGSTLAIAALAFLRRLARRRCSRPTGGLVLDPKERRV